MDNKKEFQVTGTITIEYTIDVEADSEEQAEKEAIDIVSDMYHLNVIGAYHNKDTDVKIDAFASEYEEE